MFQIPSILDKISTLKDGSLKITIATQELGEEDTALLFKLANKYCHVAIKESPMKEKEIKVPEFAKEFKSDKTPGQRLRAVLYVYWDQNKPTKDFDSFYKGYLEKIIQNVKNQLP